MEDDIGGLKESKGQVIIMASEQLGNAIRELRCRIDIDEVCNSLEMETCAELMESLHQELMELGQSAETFTLDPVPGEVVENATVLKFASGRQPYLAKAEAWKTSVDDE